jgi:tRNA (guanine-N7-)-methyltransferase
VSKKKLQHFAETATFPNFFQPGFLEPELGFPLKGGWNTKYFHNEHPITLELGCGKGEYTVGLARKYPSRNYIGVDIKGARMWRGAKTALEEQIPNVAFVRTQISFIGVFFGNEEVSGLWITFPDPHPALSEKNKRLTSPRFLNYYRQVLKKDAVIHLKTDDDGLYQYTLEVIEEGGHHLLFNTPNLYKEAAGEEAAEIQTFYENRWLLEGKTIKYLRFTLNQDANEG